ncbi:lipoprotein insertase outer membrane protein LolB [Thermomonas sp. HDW16]|uniref:lipoprotein insertase outer membrane protein LolB n=1 Tax=Thermomonas sp. HDW16 TaxID=2714945 RepID=UPI00140E1B29|nr:lipoprotein insertase outer membrane protein LolB [Thermomonas sp. HDW16]QIL21292.1 outer membrane lipoprotein LolB [Thermomonas sp. HDW16]
MRLVIALACGVLAGCQTVAPKSLPPVDAAAADAAQLQREQRLADENRWSLSGRVAISNGKDGGSGRIEWVNDDESLAVELSAPITRQTWRLTASENGPWCVEGQDGKRCGMDAEQLLRDTTGWEIPVASLGEWLRGMRTDAPSREVRYDDAGRLSHLQQSGWTIDYRWPEAGARVTTDHPEMPTRIDAVKGQAKVKLVADAWHWLP